MCGIAGIFNFADSSPVDATSVERMVSMLHHRGPDDRGFYCQQDIGLGHSRLSVIDIAGGAQPIFNEDRTLAIVCNGEIFNYLELRRNLEQRGHYFSSNSDIEVIIHLFEEKGERCVDDLNGQFAFAIWDTNKRRLFLARDRLGIRPLFYTVYRGRFFFASEIKAIFAADPAIPRQIDANVMREIFTLWMPADRATVFSCVKQLAAGHRAWIGRDSALVETEYWDLPLYPSGSVSQATEAELVEQFQNLLQDSIKLRLHADVPVGAYLSGGLDSSAITALVLKHCSNRLKTFSVTFDNSVYDERHQQRQVIDYLQTDHAAVNCATEDIAAVFPEVVWHSEIPLLRTAPAPMFLLSQLVRNHDYKVVLSGEGADEILGGYDIFKEAKVRAFIQRNPASRFRAQLLKRLYPYLALSPTSSAAYAAKFFNTTASPSEQFYAHRARWKTTSWALNFLHEDLKYQGHRDPVSTLNALYGEKLQGVDYFSAAQYLETKTLLGNYLLSSQGDRMAMAHSVEGRYPFLDHRLVEMACRIPVKLRMKILKEKNILKNAMTGMLPASIVARKKQPYMAPDIASFNNRAGAECIEKYMSKGALEDAGLFRVAAVQQLLKKCHNHKQQSFRENMAFTGILSAQILHERFVRDFPAK